MSYVIDLDLTQEVLRVTTTGTVAHQECRDRYARLRHFAATGGPYAGIFDISGVTKDELSAEAIRDLAHEPPAVSRPVLRVAVAPRLVDYGMGRMFELWRDGMGGQFQVVRSVDEAYTMLGVIAEGFSRRLFPEALAA